MNETHAYDDIIYLEYKKSKRHPSMSIASRAFQFAPFAALTGHEDAVLETERLTEEKKILDENYRSILDQKIMLILFHIQNHPLVSVTYFVPDDKKTGGKYCTITERVKKIDVFSEIVVLMNKMQISFSDILDIYEEDGNKE